MRITVIRGIAGEFHFGVATRRCVVTIVSSFKVEPSVSQDITSGRLNYVHLGCT
jgi:hypothetical protein